MLISEYVEGVLLSEFLKVFPGNRMDPFKGLKRMFSMRSLIELVKAILKVGLVMAVAILILNLRTDDLLSISEEPLVPAMEHVLWTMAWTFFLLAAATVIIAAIDVPFQIFDHQKKLRMTKQEVKEEFKNTEGDPQIKARLRQSFTCKHFSSPLRKPSDFQPCAD